MRRHRVPLLVLVSLITACGPGDAGSAGSTTATSSTPTSVTSAQAGTTTTSTTSVLAGPIDLDDGKFTLFEPGVTYFHDDFAIPIRLVFQEVGWREQVLGTRFMVIDNTAPDGGRGAHMHIGLFADGGGVEAALDQIGAHPQSRVGLEFTFQTDTLEGITFDVVMGPNEATSGCPPLVLFTEPDPSGGTAEVALEPCATSRVWLTDIEGSVIVMFGTDNVGPGLRFSEGYEQDMSELDRLYSDFINAITFCTEATPCDD